MPPSAATNARRDAAAASALAAAATEAGLQRARVSNSGNAALALFFECVFGSELKILGKEREKKTKPNRPKHVDRREF